ncbi:MAG: aldehyde dehydrogenase family protein [Planctomycetota bacterium]
MSDEKERQYADELLFRAKKAAKTLEEFNQTQVDGIVEAIYRAAFNARIELAQAAIDETCFGVLEDKVKKNVFASLVVYRDIRDEKTVGVIARDEARGILEVAHPVGPVLSMTPVTNPTSTVINKALICLKTRNPVVFFPHRAAKKCSRLAAEICYKAAREAGAPEDCIQWATKTKWSYCEAFMSHPAVGLILATTAFHFVKEAHKSGTPVLGAGQGNVPVYVDVSADLEEAARAIVSSKTFDNGTVCCSEQALIVQKVSESALRTNFQSMGGHFCTAEETVLLGRIAFDAERGLMHSAVVGQSAKRIAELAGFSVPENTTLLIASLERIGPEELLSHEILAPILAWYVAEDLEDAMRLCREINAHHGQGHTLSLFTRKVGMAEAFACQLKAGRVLINTPSSLGGLGGTYNRIHPSLTLSCGGEGGNYSTDNITLQHLLNINRIAPFDPDPIFEKIPDEAWLDPLFDTDRLSSL